MQAFQEVVNSSVNTDMNPETADPIYAGGFEHSMNSHESQRGMNSRVYSNEFVKCQYTPLLYASNYFSTLSSVRDEKTKEQIRMENENLLKQYYSSKKPISHATYRQGSITSCVDSNVSTIGSVSGASAGTSYGKAAQTWLNKLLDNGNDLADSFDFQLPINVTGGSDKEEVERRQMMESAPVKSYYSHFQKLLTTDIRDAELLRRHNMWMPTVRKEFRPLVLNQDLNTDSLYDSKICSLFLEGSKYIPRDYDTYGGCTIFPSFFSEYKLPSFCYHCGVEMNGQIFIIGGLVACHKYNEEAPSLNDFEVDGVKNLPPPLLPKIINNPSMINNSRLYVIATASSRISRPVISGTIPPPLLCTKGSKLTERHIFYYGGFEIKTETTYDGTGTFKLKKRAFVNNTAYILDTMTFKFSKVELTALPYKFVTYPTLAARFGHMQVSVMAKNWCSRHNQKSLDCCTNDSSTLNNERSSAETSSNIGGSPLAENTSSHSNNNHSQGVYTIIIFAGYRQTGDDKYEAMNDMWKIEVPIVARGKRGYYKFGGTATASIIMKSADSDPWPSSRAFFAYGLEDSEILNKSNLHASLLKNLEDNFRIEVISQQGQPKSKPIFPNIPHSRRDVSSARRPFSAKDNYSSSALSSKQASFRSVSTSSFAMQPALTKRSSNAEKVIVIHGGSNKKKVCGDMWWFNVETETWSDVTTFGKSKESGIAPIEVDLVGHSMVNVGHICVCLGGLSQADVNELYEDASCQRDASREKSISNDFLKIFDLTTQCLQGHDFHGNMSGVQNPSNPFSTSLVMSFGCTVLHVNGLIILVGGLVAERSNIKNIYMRGAILECVLPSANLAS
ncbi:hypothetical protein HG535_0E02160 [Zygotorulaspora mrakii]|uniref:Uncharacterized protein n=1 Tax=Zygotorulaspora mrakii TaxID=42260 RepID=A0A7H9B5T7_ZYGMR|nr:uncharacterized protein HG535_0E02160 [Zygotorulaspora mrakii]QLG73132.1 hypothetical protein HG535_0E02160 [Zygotorulaspora mrakii]